jgi:hypothetical protein
MRRLRRFDHENMRTLSFDVNIILCTIWSGLVGNRATSTITPLMQVTWLVCAACVRDRAGGRSRHTRARGQLR